MTDRLVFRERLRRNPRFRNARLEFLKRFPDYPHGVWTEDLVQALDAFVTEWGMAPVDPDSTDFDLDPLFYYQQVGKDGAFLIRVYPWTTETEVLAEFRRIRSDWQPHQAVEADGETVRRVMDMVNRGVDFAEIGRTVFGHEADEQGRRELEVDRRFEQLLRLFTGEDLSPEEVRESALSRLRGEEVYRSLGRDYRPGERTREFERRARRIHELLKPAAE